MPASLMTRAISGIRASAWPRFIASDSCAISLAGVGVENARGAGIERGVDGEDQHGEVYGRNGEEAGDMSDRMHLVALILRGRPQVRPFADMRKCAHPDESHRPDFDHVGHEMPQQVLDAVLQRRGG